MNKQGFASIAIIVGIIVVVGVVGYLAIIRTQAPIEVTTPANVVNTDDNYYEKLRTRCDNIENQEEKQACTISANLMQEARYREVPDAGCREGFVDSTRGYEASDYTLPGSIIWCWPLSGVHFNESEASRISTKEDTKNWKVYTNDTYGFTLKCPPEFDVNISQGTRSDIICTGDGLELNISSFNIYYNFESNVIKSARIFKKHYQQVIGWPLEDPEGSLLARYSLDGSPAILTSRNYARNRKQYFITMYIDQQVKIETPSINNSKAFNLIYEIDTDRSITTLEQLRVNEQHQIFENILSTLRFTNSRE